MSAPRILALLALLAVAPVARAEVQPPPQGTPSPAPEAAPEKPAEKPAERRRDAEEAEPPARRTESPEKMKEEVRREVLDEVRRELDKTKQEIRDEVSYVESAEDARNYDAKQLKELKQTVNLLQLHGYFRARGDLFNRADLGRGADATGNYLFPKGIGDYLGAANMRLRLNPVLRVSDDIALYAQIDVLDNVVAGENPFIEPFFDPTTGSQIFTSRITGQPISVKRVWAEVETPIGQLAFGRKGFHWGEGIFYNDGNCLDCDYGNTFDRIQLSVGPFLHHLITLSADSLAEGLTTNDQVVFSRYGNYGRPLDLENLDDVYRFQVAVTRNLPAADLKRQLDDGQWVINYGAFAAYRMQNSTAPEKEQISPQPYPSGVITKVGAHFIEADVYAQVLYRKLRFATEWAGIQGNWDKVPGVNADPTTPVISSQAIDVLQGAGVLRGQYALLKQDSMLVGVDFGIASGDKRPGMGARPGRPGSGPGGAAGKNDIDGPQFCQSSASCKDTDITNFRMNPDFRIDQLLWRNLFVTITDAWFARGEVRFKPGGRASGGADDDGFEVAGSIIYSQAIYAQSTPNGTKPLGVEFDASVTYTSKDRFFAALVGGFLLPLDGLNNPLLAGDAGNAKLGQVYRAVLGVTF